MQWKDAEDSAESKEEAEAFYEEEYSPLGVKAGGAQGVFRRLASPVILILAFGGLLVLLYSFLPMGNDGDQAQLKGFEARLDQIEKRMLKLESVGERVLSLEKNLKDNGTLDKRMDRMEAVFAKRFDQVDKEILQLRKNMQTNAPKKTTTAQPAQQKKVASDPAKLHTVKKGDTLYSISRKYGLTVEQLQKMNSLNKNSVIVTGQKLTVK